MIKIQRVKCIKSDWFDKLIFTHDDCHIGRFTKNKEYIAVFSTGLKTIKIYDDNLNAIKFCKPDRCGFGKYAPDYINYFEHIDNYKLLKNKKELREIVKENQKLNKYMKYISNENSIKRIK